MTVVLNALLHASHILLATDTITKEKQQKYDICIVEYRHNY